MERPCGIPRAFSWEPRGRVLAETPKVHALEIKSPNKAYSRLAVVNPRNKYPKAKKPKLKQKQYCSKLNKNFKNGSYQKDLKKKEGIKMWPMVKVEISQLAIGPWMTIDKLIDKEFKSAVANTLKDFKK